MGVTPLWNLSPEDRGDHEVADLCIHVSCSGFELFLKMLPQRVFADRLVGAIPDDLTDVLFPNAEPGHHLNVFTLLFPRLKSRSSAWHNDTFSN
jgi:hypothetical protein